MLGIGALENDKYGAWIVLVYLREYINPRNAKISGDPFANMSPRAGQGRVTADHEGVDPCRKNELADVQIWNDRISVLKPTLYAINRLEPVSRGLKFIEAVAAEICNVVIFSNLLLSWLSWRFALYVASASRMEFGYAARASFE